MEARQPQGVYCYLDKYDRILIRSYDTQTTFYDSSLSDRYLNISASINDCVSNFISQTPTTYLTEIEAFKKAKRQNVKFKQGDIFAFRINLEEYAFGRILLNIEDLRKKRLPEEHGLWLIMGKPVLIKFYAYTSKTKHIDIEQLLAQPSFPSDYIMDNALFYGEYEIIAHRSLTADEIDFPMSYGRHVDDRRKSVFFQWGAIHLELPFSSFNKYLSAANPLVPETNPSRIIDNPYGYYSIGFTSRYGGKDIKDTIAKRGNSTIRIIAILVPALICAILKMKL